MTQVRLRSVLKQFVIRMRDRHVWKPIWQDYGALSVPDAFAETYRSKRWGEAEAEEFCSGAGSGERFSAPYVEWAIRFIADHGITKVVDLGCGDFRIGRRLCRDQIVRYIGLDVVPGLIGCSIVLVFIWICLPLAIRPKRY